MMLSLIHCFIHPIKANVNKPKKKPSVLISDIIQWLIYVLTIVWNSFFFCDYNFWLCILYISCSPPIGSTVDWITNVHGYVNESGGQAWNVHGFTDRHQIVFVKTHNSLIHPIPLSSANCENKKRNNKLKKNQMKFHRTIETEDWKRK